MGPSDGHVSATVSGTKAVSASCVLQTEGMSVLLEHSRRVTHCTLIFVSDTS